MSQRRNFILACSVVVSTSMASCGQSPAPPPVTGKLASTANQYVPAATIQELMGVLIDPAADQLWDAVSITTDASGTHETRPYFPKEWQELRRAALVIVESANLLAVPGRRVALSAKTAEGEDFDLPLIQQRVDTRHNEILGFAAALREVGGKLVVATEKQDVEALTELGGTLDTVCEGCHRAFWYPEQPPIDAT
jgi:hypothetical protein